MTTNKFLTLTSDYLAKFSDIVVIGDIHGCYDEFQELLDQIHSKQDECDPNKCLKIIVGDLVNKGPKNLQVLETCCDKYPESILAVRGNHDEIILSKFDSFKKESKPLEPRNSWIKSLPQRYVDYLRQLPYTIKLPSLNAIIVHAGLDPTLQSPETETPTNLMVTMRNIQIFTEPTGSTIYRPTKSNLDGVCWASLWKGPEHVYFGHDARRRLQIEHKFATGLDTGCVYGDRLSCVYVKGTKKGQICSVNAKKVYEETQD